MIIAFRSPRRLLTLSTLLSLVLAVSASAAGLSAVVTQEVRPVLVRNAHNRLFRLTVTAEKPYANIRSLTISLSGTDDRDDIDVLEVFHSKGGGFETLARFGDATRPGGKSVTIAGHARLEKGENHFWVSCRLESDASLDHKIDGSCVRIDTSAGRVRPVDKSKGLRLRIGLALRKHFDDGVHTYRIAALATTRRRTLLCAYDMRRRKGRDLQEDIDIGLMRSVDGGQTWEPQRVIMDMGNWGGHPQHLNGCSDPGLIVDPATGQVWCFAVWMVGKEGKHQWDKDGSEKGWEIGKSAQMLMVTSTDDGRTWSKPQNMTRTWKKRDWVLFAPSPQQGIALADGTLVMPTQGRDENDKFFSNLLVSRDHGKTWAVSAKASLGNTECQAVQLGDGSIMLNSRTESPTKFRTVSVTRDLGRSWTQHPTNRKTLIEPNCNGSLYRFDFRQNGRDRYVLLFANPYSQTGRDHHSIRTSFDDGMTWPHRLLLDVGRGAGYPSLSRVDRDHVGLVYEGSGAKLVFERLSLRELVGSRR
ncbi:MAG: sialidase [Planctomycetaceae bacterium]|nr:sialidase [Planctomycetaceae bacterium]